MSEATAATPAPDPPRTQEELTAAQNVLLDTTARELAALRRKVDTAAMSQGQLTEFMAALGRVADFQLELRDLRAEGRRRLARRSLAQAWEIVAAVPEPEPAPRRARHRAPSQAGDRPLRSVRGFGLVGAAGAALRHSWVAHPVATAATGLTAATLATAAVVAPHTGIVLPFGASTSGTPNPAASVVAATPVIPPSQIAAAITRPKDGKGNARTLTVLAPPSVPAYAPDVSPVQGPGDPQGDPSSQVQQDPAPEVRLVVTRSLDLGLGSSGTIRLTAFGGPVDWRASSSVAGMNLDQASGTLPAGESATVAVSIIADLQALTGPGSVTITYDGGKTAVVQVGWTVVPLPLPPDPVPSILPTDLPTLPPILGS